MKVETISSVAWSSKPLIETCHREVSLAQRHTRGAKQGKPYRNRSTTVQELLVLQSCVAHLSYVFSECRKRGLEASLKTLRETSMRAGSMSRSSLPSCLFGNSSTGVYHGTHPTTVMVHSEAFLIHITHYPLDLTARKTSTHTLWYTSIALNPQKWSQPMTLLRGRSPEPGPLLPFHRVVTMGLVRDQFP